MITSKSASAMAPRMAGSGNMSVKSARRIEDGGGMRSELPARPIQICQMTRMPSTRAHWVQVILALFVNRFRGPRAIVETSISSALIAVSPSISAHADFQHRHQRVEHERRDDDDENPGIHAGRLEQFRREGDVAPDT